MSMPFCLVDFNVYFMDLFLPILVKLIEPLEFLNVLNSLNVEGDRVVVENIQIKRLEISLKIVVKRLFIT